MTEKVPIKCRIRSKVKGFTTAICMPSVLAIAEDDILVKPVIIPVMLYNHEFMLD